MLCRYDGVGGRVRLSGRQRRESYGDLIVSSRVPLPTLMKTNQLGYELIDFGNGRKLERFGDVLVDRPCPAAYAEPSLPEEWSSAELIYNSSRLNSGDRSPWTFARKGENGREDIDSWECSIGELVFRLRPQASGQMGLFPEHWNTWPWIASQLANWLMQSRVDFGGGAEGGGVEVTEIRRPHVLHLFAYTGATTLAMASMGAQVTHVDAMPTAVAWGRENAKLSGLEDRPIRWIADDARRYVARELRRGVRYELIVLDPPSYGHGTKGQSWEIHRDLVPLVEDCWELLSERPIGMVLTGHSPDVSFKEIRMVLEMVEGETDSVTYETNQASLLDRTGRVLDCGYVAKFVRSRLS